MRYLHLLLLLVVSTEISGCSRNNLLRGFLSNPSTDTPTVPPAWYHPKALSDNISVDGTPSYYASSAMDAAGNIIVAWMQEDSVGDYQIFKSEYRNGTWIHPTSLSDNISPDGRAAWYPKVTMNNNGVAIIVWYQSDGTRSQIFKSEYRNGAWTHPANLNDNISPDGSDAYVAEVALNESNDAIIVWHQNDLSFRNQIFKSEYRSGVWTHPADRNDNISPDGQSAIEPKVVMNNSSQTAIIVWQQSNGTHSQIFKSEYRGGSWTHPSGLNDNISPDGQNASQPKLAIAENDDALIAWHQSNGTHNQIFKSEYRGGSWTHPADLNDNISPDGQSGYSCDVAMDDAGNSLIAWVQYVGSDSQIFKSEYRNNTWTHPTSLTDNISPDGSSVVYQPYVSLNKNGTKALIYWDQIGATYTRILKSEYSNNSWVHPSSVDGDAISPDGGDAYIDFSRGTVNNAGDAALLWWQYDGSFDQIFLSHYK